jgi:sigma-B regulation protein RsbU (phosphoserine phosphatase)
VKLSAPLARITGTLLLTAFLLVALAVAVQGAFATRASLADTFSRQSAIQRAQTTLEELLRLQIAEESLLRGYSLTRDSFYVDQYQQAVSDFDARFASIHETLASQNIKPVQRMLDEYASLQMQWRAAIAAPILRHPDRQLLEMDKRNKLLSDYETKIVEQIRAALADTNAELAKTTQTELDRSSYARAFWLLVFGLLAILFNGFRSRLYQELEEEKNTTEILQRAFRSESVPLPHCEVGSAYLSASSHLAVGGDVFDVYRLSHSLALVLIADVSGKGVDAAVLTAFIKFTIRGIALRRRDPGAILAEFNTAFSQTVENPYLFVSMFVAVLDTDTFQLRYASAGHDSAFMRRATGVQQLSVTGPVLGVMEEPFGTKAVVMENGDTLVLATDGLTEARKRTGEQLRETGAMDLIEHASVEPQLLADELVAQVRALGGNRLRDDLAILAIRVIAPKEERPHA